MKEELKVAEKSGFDRLMVESDSDVLIHHLNDGMSLISWLGYILSDIIHCSLQFTDILFNFIPGAFNCVEYKLVQFELSSLVSCKWVNSILNIISDIPMENSVLNKIVLITLKKIVAINNKS